MSHKARFFATFCSKLLMWVRKRFKMTPERESMNDSDILKRPKDYFALRISRLQQFGVYSALSRNVRTFWPPLLLSSQDSGLYEL